MSVPVRDREDNYYNILNGALALATYTIKICCNKNVFAAEYQSAVTDDLIRLAKDIYILLFDANNIRTDSPERDSRVLLMRKAIGKCNEMLASIYIAQRVFHLSTKRIKYWGASIINLRNHIRQWMDYEKRGM